MDPDPPQTTPSVVVETLHRHPLLSLAALVVSGGAVVSASFYTLSTQVSVETSKQYAWVLTRALDKARNFYSSQVTDRVRHHGVLVSHDYRDHPNAIPNPATFTIELSEEVTMEDLGVTARLYSDHPFERRVDGGPRDAFERDALVQLRQAPTEPFWRVEEREDGTAMRYAQAIVMAQTCVQCHNAHPQSPRRDWKVGDVRGAQSIELPLDGSAAMIQDGVLSTTFLMFGLTLFGLALLAAIVGRLRGSLAAEQETNAELRDTHAAVERFVPYPFLEAIGRSSVRDVERGDCIVREMEVLFCDLRSFTTLVEGMSPAEAYAFVNQYLAVMEPALHAEGGFINQYLGDCIMALFPGGADGTLRATVGMLSALDGFNAQRAERHEAPVQVGVGVSAGPLMLGTIGGGERLDQGVVGDDVNLAARLEELTKHYGTRALVSDGCVQRLEEPERFSLREVDLICPKGKKQPVRVFELLDALPPAVSEGRQRGLSDFASGLALYRSRRFEEARARFERCLQTAPDDGVAQLYVRRCGRMLEHPPGEGWGGVTVFATKDGAAESAS